MLLCTQCWNYSLTTRSQERDHLMIDNRKSERKNACDPHQYPFQYLDGHECFL